MTAQPDQTAAPKPEQITVEFDYSRAVHVPGESFEVNVDHHGTVKIAFAAIGMNPKDAEVSFIAHVPPHMVAPLVNAMGMIANRMGIKLYDSIK